MSTGGNFTTCACGGPGPSSGVPVLEVLCDGNGTPFLRAYTLDADGALSYTDTTLDGSTPYQPTEPIGTCTIPPPEESPGSPGSPGQACDRFLRVERADRCDDTDGDGIPDTCYVELVGVTCEGAPVSIGTYTPDLTAPYAPVAPIDCCIPDAAAAPRVDSVRTRRDQISDGATWTIPGDSGIAIQTLIVHAIRGDATVTDLDGDTTLFESESARWGVVHNYEAALAGPLTITAAAGGVVTLTWTEAYATGTPVEPATGDQS